MALPGGLKPAHLKGWAALPKVRPSRLRRLGSAPASCPRSAPLPATASTRAAASIRTTATVVLGGLAALLPLSLAGSGALADAVIPTQPAVTKAPGNAAQTKATVITVTTVYPGASSDLVQGFITTPLQRVIAQARGIDYMTATSSKGVSSIDKPATAAAKVAMSDGTARLACAAVSTTKANSPAGASSHEQTRPTRPRRSGARP